MSSVIVTGARGYVGSVLSDYLNPEVDNVLGFDVDWFRKEGDKGNGAPSSSSFEAATDAQLANCDTLFHLAAVSNDPMGHQFNQLTTEVNVRKTIKLLRRCSQNGVRRVVFASSCSVYGTRSEAAKTELSRLNPLTVYAKSKATVEQALLEISQEPSNKTEFLALRFATAAGPSNNFRVDLVLNDFVWSALADQDIRVMSDGSPVRPIIDVRDMARAMLWAKSASVEAKFSVFNIGQNQNNFSVLELAQIVSKIIGGVEVKIEGSATVDERSYEVDFSKFQKEAELELMPIEKTIADLIDQVSALQDMGEKRSSFVRLHALAEVLGDKHV